jgi:hypothetical protein
MSDIDLTLDVLADRADEISKVMHASIQRIEDLAGKFLANVEEVGGDREYNYALYADLMHAAQEAHRIHVKVQTVSRHARRHG